jgi:hypothetical protein
MHMLSGFIVREFAGQVLEDLDYISYIPFHLTFIYAVESFTLNYPHSPLFYFFCTDLQGRIPAGD